MSSPRQNGKHRVRRWLPYAGLVVLAGLIIAGFWPQPVPVETVAVNVGKLRATVNEEGKTRIKQRYTVSAPVTGQLRRIPFKAGAEVKGGATILAVIEPVAPGLLDARSRAAAEARRDAAAANLEKARNAHKFASSELRRFERLSAQNTVSVQELEAAQMRDESALKEETASAGALRQAEAELAEFTSPGQGSSGADCQPVEIKTPTDGRVLRVFEENARVVTAGTPLVEIGDPADLEVVVDVLSRDGAAIKPGAKVEFEEWGGAEPLEGRVRLVEPAAFTKVSALGVEEQRVNVIADLVAPSEQRRNLGDNFRVEARIEVWQADDVVKVPAGALFRQEEQWAAFVAANGRAQLRRVKVGHSSGSETQVMEGLKAGEEVILYPGSRVKDGQRVKPIKI
jgi:HlyD family secretion protein